MTWISKISMTGFKSFGERTVTIKLSSGFTCIVGPNGAGKSNIIDALCFCLGRLSKKTMRAKSLEDLIFAGAKGKNPSNRASVTIYFDNSEGIFPGGTETFDITRIIKRGGGGGYKMNGQKTTRTQILNALAAANIDPEGSNQFVLQGKIVELTHMNGEDRRKFIEELIGLQKYDEMKDATLKELEKAERDLGQFEAIFKEVSSQLQKVEKEKNDALAWKELEDQINHFKAQLIALKISRLRKEEDELEEKIEESRKVMEELEEKITQQEDLLKQETLIMENIQGSITQKEKEREEIKENITQFKTQLSSNKTTLNLSKKSIEKLEQDIQTLTAKQMELEEGQTLDSLIEGANKDNLEIENNIEGAKEEIEKSHQNQAEFDANIKNNEKEKSAFKAEISKIKQNISSNKAQIKMLKQNIKKNEEKKVKLEAELSKLKGEAEGIDEAIQEAKKIESEIRKKIEDLNKKITEEDSTYRKNEKEIDLLQMKQESLTSIINDNKSKIDNINTEFKIFKKELTNLERDKKDLEIEVTNLNNNISKINKESESLNNKKKNIVRRIEELSEEKASFLKRIESSEEDYEKNTEAITGILQILNMLTQNISISVDSIKGDIQLSNAESIELSATNFKDFISDIIEIMKTLEDVEYHPEKAEETSGMLNSIVQTLSIFTDNADDTIEQLIEKVKLTSDVAIQESTSKFDSFVMDLMEILQNVPISLKKLTLSKSQELYQQLEEISENIKGQSDDLNEIEKKLTEINSQNKHDSSNLSANNRRLEGINKRIQELSERTKNSEVEIKERTATIDEKQKEAENLNGEVKKFKELKENFWKITEDLRKQKEEESKKLEEVVDRLRGLENVMRIITSIEDLKKENLEASESSENSEKEVESLDSKVIEVQKSVDEKQQVVDSLNEEKAKEIEVQKTAQTKLNKLNKDLQKSQGKINELTKNKEREQQIVGLKEEIKSTEKQIETLVDEIAKIEEDLSAENEKKDAKQVEIDKLVEEKDESWKKQKEYQKTYTDLKSDHSLENSKMNNFESKKIICNDQIETYYQRSKEYGSLPPVTDELSEEGLNSDIEVATKKKKALEPVNLKAIEQYDIVKERFDEIDMRRQAIQRERKAIMDAIEKIELEKTRSFMKSYHEINREFSRVFQLLSPGGSAKMILDRPDSPFEGGISIEARPRGKKVSSLEILSGGEKTLVALSFIFAVQEFYPAPFYVMDEIDAALDGPNVHRTSMVIKEFAAQAQFLVISHREENIVNSDRIYGVSMQQSGITDIFSVDLEEEAKRLLELEDVPANIE